MNEKMEEREKIERIQSDELLHVSEIQINCGVDDQGRSDALTYISVTAAVIL